jgi:hypothetical protein
MNIIWPKELDLKTFFASESPQSFTIQCSDCGKVDIVYVDGDNKILCKKAANKQNCISYFCQDCFESQGYGLGSCHSNNRFINMVNSI